MLCFKPSIPLGQHFASHGCAQVLCKLHPHFLWQRKVTRTSLDCASHWPDSKEGSLHPHKRALARIICNDIHGRRPATDAVPKECAAQCIKEGRTTWSSTTDVFLGSLDRCASSVEGISWHSAMQLGGVFILLGAVTVSLALLPTAPHCNETTNNLTCL